jgi:Nodulation protein A (NodA)
MRRTGRPGKDRRPYGDVVIVISRWETALTEADHAALSELLTAAFGRHPGVFARRSWAMARKEARLWLADDAGMPLAHLALERRLVGVAGVRPTLITAGRRPVEEWPDGPVDLRGLPW